MLGEIRRKQKGTELTNRIFLKIFKYLSFWWSTPISINWNARQVLSLIGLLHPHQICVNDTIDQLSSFLLPSYPSPSYPSQTLSGNQLRFPVSFNLKNDGAWWGWGESRWQTFWLLLIGERHCHKCLNYPIGQLSSFLHSPHPHQAPPFLRLKDTGNLNWFPNSAWLG